LSNKLRSTDLEGLQLLGNGAVVVRVDEDDGDLEDAIFGLTKDGIYFPPFF
jgi:hypothetical protein